ncbi:MAG TPA: hypothetical protein VIK89_07075 [Cytophagaceae bacterium]
MNKSSNIKFWTFLSFLFLSINGFSQLGYYNHAAIYSNLKVRGSARVMGIGGGGTALGADLGTIVLNPAGYGLTRKSEFSFSPVFGFANTESSYLGTKTNDNKTSFSIGQMGLVFATDTDPLTEEDWRGGTFGITFTRTNEFNNQFAYKGLNSNNSITDYFVEIADGLSEMDLSPADNEIEYLDQLVYKSYLIDPNPLYPNRYFSVIGEETVSQEEIVLSKGGQYQWDIAYGANYMDKLYIGGSLGIASIRHIQDKSYKETILPTPDTLVSFIFNDNTKTTGTGINFKFGIIYKINDFVRLGTSIQTPTWYTMKDSYIYQMRSKFFNYDPGNSGYQLNDLNLRTIPATYKYSLTTPLRWNSGAAVFFGKNGFLSADVEVVPYNSAVVQDPEDRFLFSDDNRFIKDNMRTVANIRAGGEYRIQNFNLRAGAAVLPDPFKNTIDNVNRTVVQVTAGAGMRSTEYYLDVALVKSYFNSIYKPYTLSDGTEPTATIKNRLTNFVITAGAFF